MIVKNGYSIILGNTQRGIILNNPRRKILNIGEELPPLPESDGLFGTRYVGYFGSLDGSPDNPDWFLTATPHGDTNQLTQINNFSSFTDNYSWEWTGYFRANSTENYTFYTNSDDASYIWIGDVALSGYNVSNALVNNGGPHGDRRAQGTTGLVYNQYYPIRIQFGEAGGGDFITVNFSTNRIPETTNGSGYYFGSAPAPYFGRVLSLDAVPYDRNPNQIIFTNAGVITANGVYVYTETGAPYMFSDTGFVGPLTYSTQNHDYKNDFVQIDYYFVENNNFTGNTTGYFLGEWYANNYTYFNTGNIPFVNRVEVPGNMNVSDTYSRVNSGDNVFYSPQNGRRIIKNQNSGWDLQDDNNITLYTNDDINLDPNGWYYDFISSIIISDAGTATSNGTYTRSAGGDTTFTGPNGNYIEKNGATEFSLWDTQLYNPDSENYGAISYLTENFSNWYVVGNAFGESPDPVGLTSTTRVYPASKTDGLLGIQYSGYFDSDPTWFNTASVKPIINEIVLAGSSESKFNGTYTKTNYGQPDQGVAYYSGDNGNFIYYSAKAPANESYWYLNYPDTDSEFISYNLETWIQNPTGPYGSVPPSTTITQTQNFENSTNFGVGRALSNDTSWQWFGYFKANDTSNHNFYLNADEDAYFWIGDKALNGYTTGNADIYSTANNGSSIINLPLTSGTYYPVRIQWGHPGTPTQLGLGLSYRNGIQGNTYDFSGLFFNFTGDAIAANSNGYVYDFTLGEWQSTYTGYDPAPNAAYSHVWLDSISGFNNSGVMYTGNKHVTLVNNPVYSSDFSGTYSFNGVDQYALTQEVPQSANGSISYFVWFKPTGAGTVVSELGQPQINAGWHDSQLEVMQDGKVNFGIWGAYTSNPEFKIQSTGSINFDRWHHLGLTYAPTSASSGVLSAYINGEKIADSNCPTRLVPASLYYGICAFDGTHMGAHAFGKGSVGSFQVYNTGLTEIQVGNLYSGEKDRFPNIDNMFFASLWLDASTGVNKFDYNYISQIILSGDPSVSGTYNASSVPTYNFADSRLNDYSLGSINYSDYDGLKYRIITENLSDWVAGYESSNGVNWSTYGDYIAQLIITGFTGIYNGANGTYSLDNNTPEDPSYNNGVYQFYSNELRFINENAGFPIIATKNNDGSFSPATYITSVTLSNASTTFVNGTYTRGSSAEQFGQARDVQFTASEGRSIYFDDGDGQWLTNPGGIYSSSDLGWWAPFNDESPEQIPPSVSIGGTARNIGSPRISESFSSPSGSITGTITTSNVVTDYVSSWTDQSANARDVAQNSDGLASLTTIANKKFINFPANTTLGRQSFFNKYTGTVFVVARFDSSSAGSHANLFSNEDGFVLSRGADSSNAFYLENQNSDYSENRTLSNINVDNNANYIIGATFENNTASLYLNGVDAGNGSIGNLEVGYNLFIGGSNVGGSGPSEEPSNIAEVIAYNRVLTTSERQEVENYLKNKYAFSDTIYYGEDNGVCDGGVPILATGDGLTFCESNTFTSNDFLGIGDGYIYIRYNGQYKTVYCQSADNFVTYRDSCTACP